MKIQRNFFKNKTIKVAKELLGKYLIRNYNGKLLVGKIIETEAYIGPKDKASHAYSKKEQPVKEKIKIIEENWERIKNYVDNKNLFIERILRLKNAKVTKRNLAEYLRGGHIYIYLVYGNYYQLNITTYKEGYPECVLIRSLEPILNLKNPKGPGRLCEELKLDSSFWGEDVVMSKRIWVEDEELARVSARFFNKNQFNETQHKNTIVRTTRIGIDYAEECKFLKWRFYIKNNKWVSRK